MREYIVQPGSYQAAEEVGSALEDLVDRGVDVTWYTRDPEPQEREYEV